MSVIEGPKLAELIERGVIDALPGNVNGASIDVRIGNRVMIEIAPDSRRFIADLDAKESITFDTVTVPDNGLIIYPGQCFLAHTVESLNLPDDISCEFKLRSSVARCFMNHCLAGWADPGFHGTLTLEFVNMTQHHMLRIRPGQRIGQLVFFQHGDSCEYSYRHRGRYGGQTTAQAGKGIE